MQRGFTTGSVLPRLIFDFVPLVSWQGGVDGWAGWVRNYLVSPWERRNPQVMLGHGGWCRQPASQIRGAENREPRLLTSAGINTGEKLSRLPKWPLGPRWPTGSGEPRSQAAAGCSGACRAAPRVCAERGFQPERNLKTRSVLSGNIWKMDEREHLHHLL